MKEKRVTLSDIAKEVGVSVNTVSHALNDKNDISERKNIMFILNFKNQTVFRGHASQAFIALDAESKKPVNASFSLVGNTSCNTRTNGNRVMVAADEKADTLTFIAEYQGEVQKAELHVADASGKTTEFK